MELAVVIVVKDNPNGLSRTIDSLQGILKDVSIIFVTPSDNSATHVLANNFTKSIRNSVLVEDDGLGIYPAMNKALSVVGDETWVWFLNAEDELYSEISFRTLMIELAHMNSSSLWAFCGYSLYESDETFIEERKAPELFSIKNQLYARTFISHQATIVKSKLLKMLGGFDTRLQISADWDIFCRMNNISKPVRIDIILTKFKLGGLSSLKRNKGNFELLLLRYRYLSKISQFYSVYWFIYRVFRNGTLSILEQISPNLVKKIRKFRSRLRDARA